MNILRNCVVGSFCLRDARDHIITIFLASHFNGKCHVESSVKSQRVLYLDLEFLEKFLFVLILDPKFEPYVMIFSLLWLWTSGSIFSFPFQVIFQRSSPGESCRTSELRPTATLDTFLSVIKVHLGGICCIIHTLYFNPDVLLCTQECLCVENIGQKIALCYQELGQHNVYNKLLFQFSVTSLYFFPPSPFWNICLYESM